MGANKELRKFADEFIRARDGDRVVDFGCGTSMILSYLPSSTKYYGFDISHDYIQSAKLRYGNRAHFECRIITEQDATYLPKFDIALALGVLHHLDDEMAHSMLHTAYQVLKKGGRLITIDGCYDTNQTSLARLLVNLDRGQNVRNLADYSSLANAVFSNITAIVRHRAWVPYTHCIMECTK
jgi:SAM-dependent methyltransferase